MVGQAFLSESLIANVVQSALVIVTTLWFKYTKHEKIEGKTSSKRGSKKGKCSKENVKSTHTESTTV